MPTYSDYFPYRKLHAFVNTSTHRAQYSCDEFKQLMHVRLQQLEAHADAPAYAPVLAALRQNLVALQNRPAAPGIRA